MTGGGWPDQDARRRRLVDKPPTKKERKRDCPCLCHDMGGGCAHPGERCKCNDGTGMDGIVACYVTPKERVSPCHCCEREGEAFSGEYCACACHYVAKEVAQLHSEYSKGIKQRDDRIMSAVGERDGYRREAAAALERAIRAEAKPSERINELNRLADIVGVSHGATKMIVGAAIDMINCGVQAGEDATKAEDELAEARESLHQNSVEISKMRKETPNGRMIEKIENQAEHITNLEVLHDRRVKEVMCMRGERDVALAALKREKQPTPVPRHVCPCRDSDNCKCGCHIFGTAGGNEKS